MLVHQATNDVSHCARIFPPHASLRTCEVGTCATIVNTSCREQQGEATVRQKEWLGAHAQRTSQAPDNSPYIGDELQACAVGGRHGIMRYSWACLGAQSANFELYGDYEKDSVGITGVYT